jgi:hypothetical protein
MEAVEPLSGFEVGGQQYVPCPHPPTPWIYNKKSTFKSEVISSLKSCFISKGNKSKNKKKHFFT